MFDLAGKRILVTGASGFVGKHLMRGLAARNCEARGIGHAHDLREWEVANRVMSDGYDSVFHLAARCGGIGANMAAPVPFMVDNLEMGLNVLNAVKEFDVKKLIMIGTICSYPQNAGATLVVGPHARIMYPGEPRPIRESDLWSGYPEPTNAPYGIAKRTLIEVGKAYHKQYGLNVVNVLPANMYGPGDSFDPETSHVIPALIRKFTDAVRKGVDQVTCWGTGQATRDFLYVEDACEAIIRAAERIDDDPEPVNIGTGRETTIRGLAERIAGLCGFHGSIRWDKTRPDGQPRRVLDTTRQRAVLDWQASVPLEDGLRRTVEWWQNETRQVGEFRKKPGLRDVPDPVEK